MNKPSKKEQYEIKKACHAVKKCIYYTHMLAKERGISFKQALDLVKR